MKTEHAMYLHNISWHDKCTNDMPKSGGGSLLLQFVVYFVDILKNKKKYDIEYIFKRQFIKNM